MSESNGKKVLIVYYSRTGTAKIVAEELGKRLGCDVDRITYAAGDNKQNALLACIEAFFKKMCEIKGDDREARKYARVIVVSPVWAFSLATPARSYLKKHAANIASFSLICAFEGSGDPAKDAAAAAGKQPAHTATLLKSQIMEGKVDYDTLLAFAE